MDRYYLKSNPNICLDKLLGLVSGDLNKDEEIFIANCRALEESILADTVIDLATIANLESEIEERNKAFYL